MTAVPVFDLRGNPVRINVLESEWFRPSTSEGFKNSNKVGTLGPGTEQGDQDGVEGLPDDGEGLTLLPGVDPEVMSKKAVINSPGHVHSVEQASADHRYLAGDYEGALAGFLACLGRLRGADSGADAGKKKGRRANVQHEIVLCECVARCLLRLGRPAQSLGYLTEELISQATGPVQVELNCLLARCLLASGDFARAAARAKLSLSARPLSKEAWEALAGAMQALGRAAAAQESRRTLQKIWGVTVAVPPADSHTAIEEEEREWFAAIDAKIKSVTSRKDEELDPTRLEG